MCNRYFLGVAVCATLFAHSVRAQESSFEEIIVTSTALRETARDIAQPAFVLSGDDLHRQVASSLGESIASQLGVSATYFGPSASRPIIRGLGGERVLMLQDGMSALDVSSLSQDHAVAVESVLADQIEILKGPATLLFGSGAVGGVVNVVDGRIPTRFTKEADRGVLELRADTAADERSGVARLELGSEHVRIHVDGFKRDTDDVAIPGYAFSAAERAEHLAKHPDEAFVRGKIENSASESSGGAFGISAGSESSFVGIAVSRYDTTYGVPAAHHAHGDEADETHEPDEHHLRIDMRQDRYDLKAERALRTGALERLRIRAAYNDYAHRELEGAAIGTVFRQTGYDVRLNLDHSELAGWRGTIGAQYVHTDFDAEGAEAFVPPSILDQRALFAFEERRFGAVTLELGARIEQQRLTPQGLPRYDETAYSFSAGAVWNLPDDYSLAANLTRSQRHPQSVELYANGPHLAVARFEIGTESLRKETARTLDLTLHRHSEDGVHWSLGAFWNDFADYIYAYDTREELDELPVFRFGQQDATFYGFEGELTFPLLHGADTRLELRVASDYVRGRLDTGEDLPQIPPLRYGLELHFEHRALHVGLQAYRHARQDKTAANERETAGYTLLALDASYRLPLRAGSLLMFLRGTNLLDEEARRHASPLKELAPLPGRSLHAGIRVEL